MNKSQYLLPHAKHTGTLPLIACLDGKRFAFAVFDETDSATLEHVGLGYSYISGCGMRFTKSVWLAPKCLHGTS